MSEIIVYSAVFGGYDTLHPTDYQSLCFTDGKMAPIIGWDYRIIYADKDPKWANRHCKLLVHEHLNTEYSIYHDGNIRMLIDPEEAVRWLEDADIAVFAHPERDCVYDEALACIQLHKAPASAVRPHMARYRQEGYPAHNGLAACWVVIRRHTEAVKRFNQAWWEEYTKGAKRDQLGFDHTCWKLGMRYEIIPGNLFKGTSKAFRRTAHKHERRS